jgi:hypothetical protein
MSRFTFEERRIRSTRLKEYFLLFMTSLVVIGVAAGLIYIKYLAWAYAHPSAPFWTFLVGR